MQVRLCRIIISFSSILFATILPTNPAQSHENHDFFKQGAYIGIKAGNIYAKKQYRYQAIVSGQHSDHRETNFNTENDYLIGLYAGYGIRRHNFYLAPELHFQHAFINWKLDNVHEDLGWERILKTNLKWFIEPRLRLGYVFDRIMIYAHGGLSFAYSRFNVQWLSLRQGIDDVVVNKSGWHKGFKSGGGIEIFLTDTLSTRVEGYYTIYDSRHFSFDILDYQSFDGKMNIHNHFGFTGGISYHF